MNLIDKRITELEKKFSDVFDARNGIAEKLEAIGNDNRKVIAELGGKVARLEERLEAVEDRYYALIPKHYESNPPVPPCEHEWKWREQATIGASFSDWFCTKCGIIKPTVPPGKGKMDKLKPCPNCKVQPVMWGNGNKICFDAIQVFCPLPEGCGRSTGWIKTTDSKIAIEDWNRRSSEKP